MIDVPGVLECIPLLMLTCVFYADYFYLYIPQINVNMCIIRSKSNFIFHIVEDFRTIDHLLQLQPVRRVVSCLAGTRNLLFEESFSLPMQNSIYSKKAAARVNKRGWPIPIRFLPLLLFPPSNFYLQFSLVHCSLLD